MHGYFATCARGLEPVDVVTGGAGKAAVRRRRLPSLILTLLVAMAFGALMELIAFRPLRTASPLAKLVALTMLRCAGA